VKVIYVLLATLLLSLTALGVVCWLVTRPNRNDDPSFICGYRQLQEIHQGLSKDDVVRILGHAIEEIDKSKTPHNFFQGTSEKEIREAWIYKVKGWRGKMEVYFDERGKVLRSNCGSG
jgi:hypothetical protein